MNKKERKALIFEMFAKGYTYAQIGKKFGISRQRVQQITRPPLGVLDALRRRAGDKCERCKIRLRAGDFHVHHVENNVSGTYADLKKVRLLCRSCHKIEDHIKDVDRKSIGRHIVSDEAKYKISIAQRKRWAEWRKRRKSHEIL